LDLAGLGAELGHIRVYGDFDAGGAQIKGDVDAADLAAFEDDILGHEGFEARMRAGHATGASGQVDDF
jgi:hypothetical protein